MEVELLGHTVVVSEKARLHTGIAKKRTIKKMITHSVILLLFMSIPSFPTT